MTHMETKKSPNYTWLPNISKILHVVTIETLKTHDKLVDITVSADGLAPSGARTSAATVMKW